MLVVLLRFLWVALLRDIQRPFGTTSRNGGH
jgi:hypothetical protein